MVQFGIVGCGMWYSMVCCGVIGSGMTLSDVEWCGVFCCDIK